MARMKFHLVGILLVSVLLCFCPSFCHKKKSSKDFSFDSILSGMDVTEKEIFKEELQKEVKKFHIPSSHHKTNIPKKRTHKSSSKSSTASNKAVSPGICDPICEHQCVHGCDFRCCIPRYQVTHNIPRPLPHITLPGACSPSCSPTCYPECTPTCCAGGPGGMFQSTADLAAMYPPTCPPPCSAACFPQCAAGCCNPGFPATSTYQEGNLNMYAPSLQQQYLPPPPPPRPHPRPRPLPRKRPFRFYRPMLATPLRQSLMQSTMERMMQPPQMLATEPLNAPATITQGFTHCGGSCPVSCAPTCLSACCMESQQEQQQQQQQRQSLPMSPATALMQQTSSSSPGMAEISNPSSSVMMQSPSCPAPCSTACAPACSSSCCNPMSTIQERNEAPGSSLGAAVVAPPDSSSFSVPAEASIVQPAAPVEAPAVAAIKAEPQAQLTCHSSCPDMCLPDCSDSCCNPGPPHTEIDKKSKISKIAAQLAMLRKKH